MIIPYIQLTIHHVYDNLIETEWSLEFLKEYILKDTFFRLSADKQSNLINSSIKEFAENTYNSASLNNIIVDAKISKGGLFKYIEGKRDLYIYILKRIMEEVIKYQAKNLDINISCYFDTLKALIMYGFHYYKEHELEFMVMMNALYDMESPCYEEVMLIRKDLIKTYQNDMLDRIDWSQYNESKENILKISEYIIDGYNIAFVKRIDQYDSVVKLETSMKYDLELIINTIRKGIKGWDNAKI